MIIHIVFITLRKRVENVNVIYIVLRLKTNNPSLAMQNPWVFLGFDSVEEQANTMKKHWCHDGKERWKNHSWLKEIKEMHRLFLFSDLGLNSNQSRWNTIKTINETTGNVDLDCLLDNSMMSAWNSPILTFEVWSLKRVSRIGCVWERFVAHRSVCWNLFRKYGGGMWNCYGAKEKVVGSWCAALQNELSQESIPES